MELERTRIREKIYGLDIVPDERRKRTDSPCFLLLIAAWILMTYLGVTNIRHGDPHLLLSGVNDQGQVCGHDNPVKSLPYFYTVLNNGVGVCVSSCPADSVTDLSSTNPADYYCLYDIVSAGLQTSEYISSTCFVDGLFDFSSGCGCMIQSATVTSPLKRCRFTETLVADQFKTQQLTGMLWTFVGDIYSSSWVVFGYGIVASILISLAYFRVQQHQCIDEAFLYFNIVGLFGLFGCFCYFAYSTFHSANVVLIKVLAFVIAGLTLIVLLLIVTQISKIHMSTKIISQSFRCMDEMMPAIFQVPFSS